MSKFPDEHRYSAPELFRSRLRDELLESVDLIASDTDATARVGRGELVSLTREQEYRPRRVRRMIVPVAASILIAVGFALYTRDSDGRQTITVAEPVSACIDVAQSINALGSSTGLDAARLDALTTALGEFFDEVTLDRSSNAADVATLGRAVGAAVEMQLDFAVGDTAGSLRALVEVDRQLNALSSGLLVTTREGFSCP